jgi:thioredoxin 1
MPIELTDENFKEEIENSDELALVDFWAPWCGPCRMLGPIIEEIAEEFRGKIKVGKLNVDENPETASKYEILSIPALKFFKEGRVVEELTGLQPKEVFVEKISNLMSNNQY